MIEAWALGDQNAVAAAATRTGSGEEHSRPELLWGDEKDQNSNHPKQVLKRSLGKKVGRADQTHPPLLLDTWLEDSEELTSRTMDDIERMAPFGHGNPEPLIGMRQMRTLNKRRVGGSHLKMTLERGGREFDAIGFELGCAEIIDSEHPCWDVVCAPRREYWDGRYRLSLRVIDLQPS